LQARELGLSQINIVVRNVTKGVNAGLGDKGDVEKVLADAVAGMDDALLKVVEANQVALTKLTEGGASFEESSLKKALDELEKLEDRFRDGITQGTQEAGARLTYSRLCSPSWRLSSDPLNIFLSWCSASLHRSCWRTARSCMPSEWPYSDFCWVWWVPILTRAWRASRSVCRV
jgi:Family of unknown function (DUF6781)